MEASLLNTFAQLGVAGIALYALILVLRGRNDQDKAETVLATQLVALVSSSQEAVKAQTEAIKAQTEAMRATNGDLNILIASQTTNIVANTSAVMEITRRVQDEFMPSIAGLFTEQQQKLLSEFRPVVEQLSRVYFSVREIQGAIETQQAMDAEMAEVSKAHWAKETQALANLRLQQAGLQTSIVGMSERIESIFVRVIQGTAPLVVSASVTQNNMLTTEEELATEMIEASGSQTPEAQTTVVSAEVRAKSDFEFDIDKTKVST